MTKQRALIKRLITNALNGHAASIKLVTSIMNSMPVKKDDIVEDLSDEDTKILQDFIERNTNK